MTTNDRGCGEEVRRFLRPMGIFWDIKSCPIPAGVNVVELPNNVVAALRGYLPDYYPKVFFAYGVSTDFPPYILRIWEQSGVIFRNIGCDHKYPEMHEDMVDLALDHPFPQGAGMVVISRKLYQQDALWKIRLSGHQAAAVTPSCEPILGANLTGGGFISLLDWLYVARGSIQVTEAADEEMAVAESSTTTAATIGCSIPS